MGGVGGYGLNEGCTDTTYVHTHTHTRTLTHSRLKWRQIWPVFLSVARLPFLDMHFIAGMINQVIWFVTKRYALIISIIQKVFQITVYLF